MFVIRKSRPNHLNMNFSVDDNLVGTLPGIIPLNHSIRRIEVVNLARIRSELNFMQIIAPYFFFTATARMIVLHTVDHSKINPCTLCTYCL